MKTEVAISGADNAGANYLTWTPVPATIRLTQPSGSAPVKVVIDNAGSSQGGRLVYSKTPVGIPADALNLTLKANGAKVTFYVAGKFNSPSKADKDAALRVRSASGLAVLSTTTVMVRIRKNANKLTTAERKRLIGALAALNDAGTGLFGNFRAMHTQIANPEAHGAPGFLSWHRAYLLDLERALQTIDPSVALPYWKFDAPAPKVFKPEFLGVPDRQGRVSFAPSNPLQYWSTDQSVGILRTPLFNTATAQASSPSLGPVMSEALTLDLGQAGAMFENFMDIEGDPHGYAHMSFGGYLSIIAQAPRDPLFFLLHANVDRLWAKWQWLNKRFDGTVVASFPYQGAAGSAGSVRIGHNLKDTMWPWNGVTTPPRPNVAPGGPFPAAHHATAPGPTPQVGSMIDYQGKISQTACLGFDYDDVPFVP